MDFLEFPSTQVCDQNEDFQPTQSTESTGNLNKDEKNQVGVLIVNDTEFPIFTGINTIGRHATNDIVLKDSTVSKHHAEIEGRRRHSFICDFKSCNKTIVNREKLLPNRLYQVCDGDSLRIGSIVATYKKLSSLNDSIIKTPAVPRSNEIIASTPDSILNTTNDDSSVVYGTQKESEASSEFRRPSQPPQRLEGNQRNLQLEFLNDDSLLNSESGSTSISEQETQTFLQPNKSESSGIHDLETQEVSFKSPEAQNQNSDDIHEEATQACGAKIPVSHSKVHDEVTQAFEFKSPTSRSKKINTNIPRIEDSETGEAILEGASVSTKFDNIHEEATQAFSLESPKTRKSAKFTDLNKDDSIIADSDTDEEGLFEEATQKVSANRKIDEEATQACPVNSTPKIKNSEAASSRRDSDTDEEGVFAGATQKVLINRRIDEEATQACPTKTRDLGTASRTEDSDTDDEGVFEGVIHKVSKNHKIDEEATQVCPVKIPTKIRDIGTASRIEDSGTDEEEIFEGATQKVSINRKIDEEETQACPVKSPLNNPNLAIASRIEDSDTDEEGVFEGATQKVSTNRKIDEEETQACPINSSTKIKELEAVLSRRGSDTDEEGLFEGATQKVPKNHKIDEEATQACPVKSLTKTRDLETGSRIEDSDTDEEGVFEGATQKVSTNRKIDEDATQACPVNSTTKIKDSEAASSRRDSDTDEEGVFAGATQKVLINRKIDEEETQACPFKNPTKIKDSEGASSRRSSDTDEEGVFEGDTQNVLRKHKIDEEATQVCSVKSSIKIKNLETDEEALFEQPTQVVSSNKSSSNKATISTEGFSNIVDNYTTERIESLNISNSVSKPLMSSNRNSSANDSSNDEGNFKGFKSNEDETLIKSHVRKSKLGSKSLEKKLSETAQDSDTGDENVFQKEESNTKGCSREISKTPIQKVLEFKNSLTGSKTNSEVSAKAGSKLVSKEDSETDDEGVFEKEEANMKRYKGKKQLKTAGPKVKINKTKNGEKFETDDDFVPQAQNFKSKTLKSKMKSKKSNSSTQEEEMSPKPSTSKKNDSETDDDLFEPKSFSKPSAPTGKKENHSQENEIDHDAPTQILSIPSPKRKSTDLINASIEDIDYEMAPTQLLEDWKASEVKTPENKTSSESKTCDNKSNSEIKTNSGRRINSRLNPKSDDTIEENMNKMFEGEDEEISEPSQMLTQQLENILENTQVNEELVETPSTSRTRNARRNETSPEKTSPSLSKRSSRSKNSYQVCKFNFKRKPKASSGLQVSISPKDKTCKSSDESDDDFVPFVTRNFSIKSNINLKSIPWSPSSSTSSEMSFKEDLKGSPSLMKSWNGRKSLKSKNLINKKLKGLSSVGSLRMHEEVEKFASSKSIEVDSEDDSDFEEIKRIADRVLKSKNVYTDNKNASKVDVANVKKVSREKSKVVESPSVFQVDADNFSPRMSKLNIIRSKKEKKVETSPQKNSPKQKSKVEKTKDNYPLKKRPLQMSEEEPGSSTGKRLKVVDNEELEITSLIDRRSAPFGGSPKTDKNNTVEEKIKEKVKEPEKTNRGRGKKNLDSSSTDSAINETIRKPMKRGRPTKTKTTDNLEVPSKAKKIKKAEPVPNEVGNEENDEKAPKTRSVNKRQVNKSKDIIDNSSSSSSLVENSFNETASEKLKKPEPKKASTRGRKKKEVSDTESMMVDNSSASSSMVSLNGTSDDGSSSAALTPTRAKRSRNSSPLKHKILFTGIPANKYQTTLRKLGLTDTELSNNCTVLVTDKVRRTLKFLLATSKGIPIVSVNWLVDSGKRNSLQDLEKYIVKDPDTEAKYGFNLSDSLKKARDKKMLEGFTVVLTPNINGPTSSELKELVLASGGKALLRSPAKWPENTLIVSDDNDLNNAKKFMAKAPKAVTLHSKEFLLTGILQQKVDLKSHLLKIA